MSPAFRKATAILFGVLCHGLFLAGVGTMIVMMYFGMSLSFGRVDPPWRWMANAALLLQFPLGHSLLLTGKGRALLARLAPAGLGGTLSTTTYVTIASIQVFLLFALWSPTGVVWWQAQGPLLIVMTALYASAWLLLGKAMADAGLSLQMGYLGWWALLRDRKPVYPPMPASGLFRLSRQPIYVAFTLTLWTVPTWTPDQLVLALVLTLYCVAGPLFKEARFQRIHGDAFSRYRSSVPYWLPWPRPAAAPYTPAPEAKDGQ
jgi:methanethiol S-methyltransferase